jgi:hypothetical protein
MPKKDTASAVLGMLSTAGAQTRVPVPEPPAPEVTPPPAPEPDPDVDLTSAPKAAEEAPAASVSTLPSSAKRRGAVDDAAPRTLRLRSDTAARLRAAWLEAKRDDVLLTAQDFASDLVEDALARHRRRRAVSSS